MRVTLRSTLIQRKSITTTPFLKKMKMYTTMAKTTTITVKNCHPTTSYSLLTRPRSRLRRRVRNFMDMVTLHELPIPHPLALARHISPSNPSHRMHTQTNPYKITRIPWIIPPPISATSHTLITVNSSFGSIHCFLTIYHVSLPRFSSSSTPLLLRVLYPVCM